MWKLTRGFAIQQQTLLSSLAKSPKHLTKKIHTENAQLKSHKLLTRTTAGQSCFNETHLPGTLTKAPSNLFGGVMVPKEDRPNEAT